MKRKMTYVVKANLGCLSFMLAGLIFCGCENAKEHLEISEKEMAGSIEIVNRTEYSIEKIYDGASRRHKEAMIRPLIPPRNSRFVKLCHYTLYDKPSHVGNLKVFCNGRWSKEILWSRTHQKFLWWKRMTFYDVIESNCRDMAGNVKSENGSWYWQDFDIDQMRWNGTMYVCEVNGDIILTNRDIALLDVSSFMDVDK